MLKILDLIIEYLMDLFVIDQDDKFDDVNTKEKLKDFLKQSGLL